MKIAIIGTGGVGGYFGGKIARAGYNVTFFARGEHLKAIQRNGLMIKSIHGDFKVDTVKATDKIQNIGKADLIILCVKAWQVKDIAKELIGIMDSTSVILPLQNGVLAVDELKEIINSENIIGGLCKLITKIESPGVINHIGVNPLMVFGELDNQLSERIVKIKELFDTSEIHSKISNDIQADLWKKFIAICIGGLLAVTRSSYGEVRELKETRQLMIDLLQEIYLLSQKIGIKIEADTVDKTVAFVDTCPYETTASLTRDVWEGKPSEIEYQNGTVVKLGNKYGVPTPVNTFVYNCILPMEKRAGNK